MTTQTHMKLSMAIGYLAILLLFAVALTIVLKRGSDPEPGLYTYAAVHTVHKDPTVFATVKGKVIPGIDLKKMFTSTPTMLAQGKQLYVGNCSGCHGPQGDGNGPAGQFLKPPPRDFTKDTGWTNGYTLFAIYKTLSEGVKGSTMPAFDSLSPEDRFALAHYVQAFGKFNHHDKPAEEIKELKAKYHLKQNVQEPSKVAVPTIMKHMAAEYHAVPPLTPPPTADYTLGARLWRRLVADPARAAEVLAKIPDWRTNLDSFAQALVSGAPGNGFRSAVALLDRTQWSRFHEEMVCSAAPAHSTGADRRTGIPSDCSLFAIRCSASDQASSDKTPSTTPSTEP